MPRVVSSKTKNVEPAVSHLPITTFCWFPPLRNRVTLATEGVAIRRRATTSLAIVAAARAYARGNRRSGARAIPAARKPLAHTGDEDVVLDRAHQGEPLGLAILRHE